MDADGIAILFIFGWIIGAIVNGMIASAKNRSVAGAVVTSIFLSPLTAYLYLLAVPPLPKQEETKK